jgi:hypothetical protein
MTSKRKVVRVCQHTEVKCVLINIANVIKCVCIKKENQKNTK